ncbi:MAG: hypothetical protein LUG18_04770 [Candidatus Azobacteroides sp.]|nr:hypothetical protein [Candidatus Azobacteroides sp.]
MKVILGISAYYHDSGVALLINGKIIAAAQEERFTTKKHDESFPVNALEFVLREAGLTGADVEYVAFYPSLFERSAILTVDRVGEWATLTIGRGNKNRIEIIRELYFPHSLGLLYSSFTYYCGFKVNEGEYKLMGLVLYGNSTSERRQKYIHLIKEYLVDIRKNGSFLQNMRYFDYATGLRMTNNKKWTMLFGLPPRQPERELLQEYMDTAGSW